jgi:biopolymer transport protein ExbD
LKGFFYVWKKVFLPSLLKINIMAEITTNTTAKTNKGKRVNKKSTRVDLTPMVDLGFLLLTFFVFTTTMARPASMNIVQPKDSDSNTDIPQSCALTVLLANDDKIFYYEGLQQDNPVLMETNFGVDGLRQLLLQKKAAVQKIRGSADQMVLILKMTDDSNYKNFVDVVDEVQITGVKHYFMAEPDAVDKKLLQNNL